MKTNQDYLYQDDSLKQYFSDISKTPLLNFEEELELSRKIISGDAKAKERLVKANLRLVVKIAKAYISAGVSLLDLIQEGNMGLMSAASKYDFSKNVRFSTYASWWIKQAIIRSITNKKRLIRLPHRKEETIRRINRFIAEYQQNHGLMPDTHVIASALDLSHEDVVGLLEVSGTMGSLDKEIGDESSSIIELIEDTSYTPEQQYMTTCIQEETRKILDRLVEKERTILMRRFSFGGGKKYTLKSLGEEMGISAETVRQIEIRAMDKLKVEFSHMKEYVYN